MKDETKLAKLAAMFGLEQHVPAPPKAPDPAERERGIQASRDMEATILYLEDPKKFKTRECGTCGLTFAVDRANISQCSDSCRKKHLLDKFGLEVDFNRSPTERWSFNTGGREPLLVPPAVITLLSDRIQRGLTA